jgi:hypothetical protein
MAVGVTCLVIPALLPLIECRAASTNSGLLLKVALRLTLCSDSAGQNQGWQIWPLLLVAQSFGRPSANCTKNSKNSLIVKEAIANPLGSCCGK